jgi:D-sedoheptulose 7-phosphate isomerase
MPERFARAYLSQVKALLGRVPLEALSALVGDLADAAASGRSVYVMGNGGSAATALHFACNAGHVNLGSRKRLRVRSLTSETAVLLAVANDRSFSEIFVEQLRTVLDPGDVVLGISASGNSPNVIRAVEFADRRGALTAALLGFDGGRLAGLVRRPVVIPGRDVKQIEDVHLILSHIIVQSLGAELERRSRAR